MQPYCVPGTMLGMPKHGPEQRLSFPPRQRLSPCGRLSLPQRVSPCLCPGASCGEGSLSSGHLLWHPLDLLAPVLGLCSRQEAKS